MLGAPPAPRAGGMVPTCVWKRPPPRVLPAPAAMVPRIQDGVITTQSAPRTRGDGPPACGNAVRLPSCSPHPRGWSRALRARRARPSVLPAPAGMVPPSRRRAAASDSAPAPRTRGDGPVPVPALQVAVSCSPHPRARIRLRALTVLPAPAGMVPPGSRSASRCRCAPRTRGDGPASLTSSDNSILCSPHPRERSRLGTGPRDVLDVLPVPAGMVPAGLPPGDRPRSAARTRGDGPCWGARFGAASRCSPHPRGWSHALLQGVRGLFVLPAPAGMVPGLSVTRNRGPCAPRTRGDGPTGSLLELSRRLCSPHPRGWSPAEVGRLRGVRVLPAPAGMVPRRPSR